MSTEKQIETGPQTDEEQGLRELSEQEAALVIGAGLLSSPLGVRDTTNRVWVREIVEDVEAY